MPHATVNGARLWYDVGGPAAPDATPILLHHGYTASRVNWAPVAAAAEAAPPRDPDGMPRHRRQRAHGTAATRSNNTHPT